MSATAEHLVIDPADHLGLLASLVRKYVPFGEPVRDSEVWSIGMIGLVKAARDFDPSRGRAFGTLAGIYVTREIWRAWTIANKKSPPGGLSVLTEDPAAEFDEIPESVAETESLQQLRNLIRQLPSCERQVVELRLQEVPFEDIGVQIGKTKQRAGQLWQRAIKRLRRRMVA